MPSPRLALLLSCLALSFPVAAGAQDAEADSQEEIMRAPGMAGPTPPAAVTDDAPDEEFTYAEDNVIVVTGYRREEVRKHVVRTLDRDGRQLSRREDPFCPRIVNFPGEYAARIEALIRANAQKANIELAPENCAADAFAIFVREPQEFLAGVEKAYPSVFDSLYSPERRRLIKADTPVYSWSMEITYDRYGRQLFGTPPQLQGVDISRLTSNVRRDIAGTYLVMDLDLTENMTLQQLADFITIHMVLDLREKATEDAAEDSILHLFEYSDPSEAPPSMSPMDFALIEALYAQPRNDVSAAVQNGRIIDHIVAKLENEGIDVN